MCAAAIELSWSKKTCSAACASVVGSVVAMAGSEPRVSARGINC